MIRYVRYYFSIVPLKQSRDRDATNFLSGMPRAFSRVETLGGWSRAFGRQGISVSSASRVIPKRDEISSRRIPRRPLTWIRSVDFSNETIEHIFHRSVRSGPVKIILTLLRSSNYICTHARSLNIRPLKRYAFLWDFHLFFREHI